MSLVNIKFQYVYHSICTWNVNKECLFIAMDAYLCVWQPFVLSMWVSWTLIWHIILGTISEFTSTKGLLSVIARDQVAWFTPHLTVLTVQLHKMSPEGCLFLIFCVSIGTMWSWYSPTNFVFAPKRSSMTCI